MEEVTPPPFDPGALAGMMITAFVAIFLPLIAVVLFLRRTGTPFRVVLQGALVFVVSQVVLRLPWFIPLQAWLKDSLKTPLAQVGFLLFAALTAALFEELGRYVGYRRLLKEHRWRTGVAFGLGHGGIESIVLVGLGVLGSAVGYVMVTRGHLPLPPEQAEAVRQAYANLSFVSALMGAVERVGTLVLHVVMSLLVLKAYLAGRKWLWLSIGVHTTLNFAVVLLAQKVSIYAAEAVMVATAIGGFIWIRRARPFIEGPDAAKA